jgi:hypothetical protein
MFNESSANSTQPTIIYKTPPAPVIPSQTVDPAIPFLKAATNLQVEIEQKHATNRYLQRLIVGESIGKQRILRGIQEFLVRYVFALIDGKYFVLDRQAVDSQGYPLGCAVVDLNEVKKLYPHLTIDVQLLREDKPCRINIFDLFQQSAQREIRNLVVRRDDQDVSEDELNLLLPLLIKPSDFSDDTIIKPFREALEANGSQAFDFFMQFLAHAAYPRAAGIGMGIELTGAETVFTNLLITLLRQIFGSRCLVITHPDQLNWVYTRLSRPTLVIISSRTLTLADKVGEKSLLEWITHSELTMRGMGKQVQVPNYTQVILLSEVGYEIPKRLKNVFTLLNVDHIEPTTFNDTAAQSFLSYLYQCANAEMNWAKGIPSVANGQRELETNPVLCFLVDLLDDSTVLNRLINNDRKIIKSELWYHFEQAQKGATIKVNQIVFGRELNRWLPLGTSKIKGSEPNYLDFKNRTCHIFPPIDDCKRIIEEKLGMTLEWKRPISSQEASEDTHEIIYDAAESEEILKMVNDLSKPAIGLASN